MQRPLKTSSSASLRAFKLGKPTLGGSSLALLFWWQSLTPTLIPRSWPVQASICAVCLAIGYGVGTLAGRGVHWLLERLGRSPPDSTRRRSGIVAGAAWLVGILLGAMLWIGWQNEQRNFMGMPPLVPRGWASGSIVEWPSAPWA